MTTGVAVSDAVKTLSALVGYVRKSASIWAKVENPQVAQRALAGLESLHWQSLLRKPVAAL